MTGPRLAGPVSAPPPRHRPAPWAVAVNRHGVTTGACPSLARRAGETVLTGRASPRARTPSSSGLTGRSLPPPLPLAPHIDGPRRGDPTDVQRHFIAARSEKDPSGAPMAPDRRAGGRPVEARRCLLHLDSAQGHKFQSLSYLPAALFLVHLSPDPRHHRQPKAARHPHLVPRSQRDTGHTGAQPLPISTPAAKTSAPPSTTWKVARRKGVSI